MSNNSCTFAVAKIRSLENNLLTKQQLEQLISVKTDSEMEDLLSSFGLDTQNGIDEITRLELNKTWELINELLPSHPILQMITVRNDFHNLKASVKALISDRNDGDYFLRPCKTDTETINRALSEKDYTLLPSYMRKTAKEAYDTAVRTSDGQLVDIIADRAAVEQFYSASTAVGSELLDEYAKQYVVCAVLKIVYRAARAGKSAVFFESAVPDCPCFDRQELIKSALKGTDELLAYIENTDMSETVGYLRGSAAAFEKWCDDKLMRTLDGARYISFGPEPVYCYYIARETELNAVRIISVCKRSGADAKAIQERMRELYV